MHVDAVAQRQARVVQVPDLGEQRAEVSHGGALLIAHLLLCNSRECFRNKERQRTHGTVELARLEDDNPGRLLEGATDKPAHPLRRVDTCRVYQLLAGTAIFPWHGELAAEKPL